MRFAALHIDAALSQEIRRTMFRSHDALRLADDAQRIAVPAVVRAKAARAAAPLLPLSSLLLVLPTGCRA